MYLRTFVLLLIALPFCSARSFAESPWATGVELGIVLTSGNTDEEILKIRADSTRDGERFKHALHGDMLRNSRDGVITARKLYTYYKADYKLEGPGSLFGRYSYENDKFSGFKYQTDLTAGYTRNLMTTDATSLEADIGAGVRESKPLTGSSSTETIVRLAGVFTWQISESAQFRQRLSTQIGDQSTISRSETSLQTTVVGNLAMKIALHIRNNSDVPIGRKKTDSETSVTLVYKF